MNRVAQKSCRGHEDKLVSRPAEKDVHPAPVPEDAERVAGDKDRNDVARDMAVLRVLDRELSERCTVPLSYMQEFYNLRLHVELLRRRLERQRTSD